MKIRSFAATHQGKVREDNEDAVLSQPDLGLFAVADGIGGLPDGEFASHRTLELLAADFAHHADGPKNLYTVVHAVNRKLYLEGQKRHPRVGVGTTLTCGFITDRRLEVVHAGDSCALLLRGHTMRQLTSEHTVAAELQGRRVSVPDSRIHEREYHMLTRCIGESPFCEPERLSLNILPGDRLLFATDGATKVCQRIEIRARLAEADEPETAVREIIRTTLARGAPDNIGLVAVFLG